MRHIRHRGWVASIWIANGALCRIDQGAASDPWVADIITLGGRMVEAPAGLLFPAEPGYRAMRSTSTAMPRPPETHSVASP